MLSINSCPSVSKKNPKVLIFSPSARGGIAEHTYYQAKALENAGAKVICLVSPSFLAGRKTNFTTITCLPDPAEGPSSLTKKFRMAWQIILSGYVLASKVIIHRPDLVLFDTYTEYLSPLWIDPHIFLSRIVGVCYAANLHDPVRSFVVGPLWWHRLSVWLAYQPLDFVLVHDKLPEFSSVPSRVRIVEVPIGFFDDGESIKKCEETKRDWGVEAGQKVFLAFGFVRDGKNLDLAIKALTEVTEAFLVIAGSIASSHERPFSFYRNLASELKVDHRCKFFEGFVSDEALADYFSAADFILLTYSSKFYSQSGVLGIAAKARKPVLASASPSPLIESVRKYSLGVIIPPDVPREVISGMRELIDRPPEARWEEFEASASWELNAKKILESAKCLINTTSAETKFPES